MTCGRAWRRLAFRRPGSPSSRYTTPTNFAAESLFESLICAMSFKEVLFPSLSSHSIFLMLPYRPCGRAMGLVASVSGRTNRNPGLHRDCAFKR